MKNTIKLFTVVLAATLSMISCGPKSDLPGYEMTETGLYYKFDKTNDGAAQPKIGDILVCEAKFRLDDSVFFENTGNPQRMFLVERNELPNQIIDGFLMLHVGDIASLAVSADTIALRLPLPDFYVKGSGQKVYFDISLKEIVSKATFEKEKENYMKEVQAKKDAEPELIKKYVTENNIKVSPTQTGLYINIIKKGNGPKVAAGKTVQINYTGKFLDGKIFDTNEEPAAKEGGIYNPQRQYQPMEYIVGQMALIPGWDEAVASMRQGDIAEVVIPSSMAYGEAGSQGAIPPFSPLVFTINLISVK